MTLEQIAIVLSIVSIMVSIALATFTIWLAVHYMRRAEESLRDVHGMLFAVNRIAERLDEHALKPIDEEELDSDAHNATQSNLVSKFLKIISQIADGDSFTNVDADSAVKLAKELADRGLQDDPKVLVALGELLSLFAAANLATYIDLLDDMFSPLTLSDKTINAPILINLGQRILAEQKPHKAVVDRFVKHRDAARDRGDFVDALAPWAVYNHKQNQESILIEILAEIAKLHDQYRKAIRDRIEHMSDANNWMREPTHQGKEIAQSYKQFLETYEEKLR